MASFTAGTTFVDGVSNDVTAAKLGALVTNATPTSGFIQDRTAETITATNDTLLIGDASDSNNLKRITVANFAQTLPTANVTTGTIETGTFGTTTSTAATITTGTIPTLVATTLVTTGTGTAAAPAIVPTGDTNTGLFFPAADTLAATTNGTERLRIDSSGNVGIGTASPISSLHIKHATPTSKITLEDSSTNRVGQIAGGSDGSGGFLTFSAGNNGGTITERLRIDSSGNVGIGTNNPSNPLHVASSNAIIRLQDTDTVGNGSNGIATWITFRDSANTQTGYFGFPADPNFNVWNITNSPMLFGTNNQERLRISNDGTILFAKSTTAVSTVGYRFDTNGESYFSNAASTSAGATLYVYSTGAAAYRFYVGLGGTVNATNTAIAAISDVRLKENIRDIDAGLNEILELKPRTFDWKEGKGANTKNARGFIAQEIEQVFPDLVDEWRDPAPEGEEPYKSVRQDLIPVLVKAIQELKAENNSIKSRVEALEAA